MIAASAWLATRLPQVEFDIDDDGYVTSENPILPPVGEIIFGVIASGIVFIILVKFGGPAIKKFYAERTARIQSEMDTASAARAAAAEEAETIRANLGDIDAERQRLEADAVEQAERLLREGRAHIEEEIAELEARAEAEIASIAGRSGDELRGEITRFAASAVEAVVAESIDDDAHQRLIEDFISNVGSSGAGAAAARNGA
ncbi:MAG: hypothetical protein WD649_02595 [Thermoleophilaceae bacterium]